MHHAAHRKTVVLTHPPKKRCFGRSNLSVALGLALFSPGAFSTTLTLGGTVEDSAHAEDYPGVDALVMTGGQWHLYGALVGGTGTSNIDTSEVDSHFDGFVFGLDVGGKKARGGVYAFSGKDRMGGTGRNERIESRRTGAGVRGQWAGDVLNVRASAGYAQSGVDSERTVQLPRNTAMNLSGRTHANTVNAGVEARLKFARNSWGMAPLVGAYYVNSRVDWFAEKGGDAALRVGGTSQVARVFSGGVEVNKTIFGAQSQTTVYVQARYLKNTGDQFDRVATSFVDSNIDFDIVGSRAKSEWVSGAAGAQVKAGKWTLSTQSRVDGSRGGKKSYALNFGATYRF